MVSTKYLLGIVVGLTGGVNGIVFGGGINPNKGLVPFLQTVKDISSVFQESIGKETSRLDSEQKTAKERDAGLKTKSEKIQESSQTRKEAHSEVHKSYEQWKTDTDSKNQELKKKQEETQQALNSEAVAKVQELKSSFEQSYQPTMEKVKKSTAQIETILQEITASNKKLIEETRDKIENLAERIFTESEEQSKQKS